jgi:hypothetical protein
MPSRIASTASCVERSRSVSSMRRMNCPPRAARLQPAVQRGACAADVQEAGGTGGETGADRDFLVGRAFAERAGLRLLPEHAVIMLAGQPTLLMHGDSLCTDDLAYQAFRAQTRNPAWRAQFLSQPLAARLAFAAKAREASKARYGELVSAGTARDRRRRGEERRRCAVRHVWRGPDDPRPHPSPGDPRRRATALPASCSATGTNRARCCGSTRTASELASL